MLGLFAPIFGNIGKIVGLVGRFTGRGAINAADDIVVEFGGLRNLFIDFKVEVEPTSLSRLQHALKHLASSPNQRAILMHAVPAGAKIAEKEARLIAPKRTGTLAAAISTEVSSYTSGDGRPTVQATITPGPIPSGMSEVDHLVYNKAGGPWGVVKGRHFLSAAHETTKDAVEATVANIVWRRTQMAVIGVYN